MIAYGSNFGANKELAERFAERSHFHGYTSDVMTLNELAESPPRTQPWLLVVMTSTYTSNPPANAAAFKARLEHTASGSAAWRACRYLVWGLGNSQWNAFLAFPRYVHKKLSELGAMPVAEFAYGDVGTPVWERLHAEWNSSVWPALLELSGARPTQAAAARDAAEKSAARELTGAYSSTAMQRSLRSEDAAGPQPAARERSASSIMHRMSSGSWRRPGFLSGTAEPAERSGGQPRMLLAPTILTNAAGMDTVEAQVLACRELLPAESPKRARHLELGLPPGIVYQVGDHIGVCPKNDEEQVERLAQHLGAALDSLFMVPKTMNIRAAPKGVVLRVRNVLTSLVDITGRPTVPLLDLLLEKVTDPAERSRLVEIRDVLQEPDGRGSPLRAAIDAGGYDLLRLLEEFPSCPLNIFELLQVAQPLRPRYYSTSSSPQIHGDGVAHVTIGLEATPVPGMPGRDFRGMSAALPACDPRGRPAECLPQQRRRVPPAGGRDEADDLRIRRHRLRADAGVPLGAGGNEARRASPWRKRRFSTASGQAASTTSTGTRSSSSPRKECSTTFTLPRPANRRAAMITSRTGSGSKAHSSGACSLPAATSTSAARSRCATPSAPPSSTSPRNTGRCPVSAQRPTSTSSKPPPATAQTSGADPGSRMDALALILTLAALVMFLFAASGRELRRFNEIAVGLVLLTAALICQFTSITHTRIGR